MKKILLVSLLFVSQQFISQTFQKTKDLQQFKGFFNFYYDESNDKMFVEINNLNEVCTFLDGRIRRRTRLAGHICQDHRLLPHTQG